MSKNKSSSQKSRFRSAAPWLLTLFIFIVLIGLTVVLYFFGPKLMTQKYEVHFYFGKGMNKYAEKELFTKGADIFVMGKNLYFPSSNSEVNYSERASTMSKFPATGIIPFAEVSKYKFDWGYYRSDRDIIKKWFEDVYARNLIYDSLSSAFINSLVVQYAPSSVFLFYSNLENSPDEYALGTQKFKVYKTVNALADARNQSLSTSGRHKIYIFCNPSFSITTDSISDTIPAMPSMLEVKQPTPYQYVQKPVWVQKPITEAAAITIPTVNPYSLKVDINEESSFIAWSGYPDNSDFTYEVSLQYTDGNGMNIELLPPTECNDCKEKYAYALRNKKVVINDFIEKRLQNVGIIFYVTVYVNNKSGVADSRKYRFNVKRGRISCIFALK